MTNQELHTTISRLLNGELSARRAEAVRAMIRDDDRARAIYDDLARAETLLYGDTEPSDEPNPALLDRVAHRLFEEPPKAPGKIAGRWLGLSSLSLAGAITAAFVFLAPGRDLATYQERGSAVAPALDGDHGLQVLRVRVLSDGHLDVGDASHLKVGDALRFAAFSRERPAFLTLLRVDESGDRQVLLERLEMAPSSTMNRLSLSASVEDDKSMGRRMTFVALFEHRGRRDPLTLDLSPRDEREVSVRTVNAEVSL